MAENRNNPFDGYSEKSVGRTVQNVTSSMWEPISAGAPEKKDTPVRKNAEQARKKTSQTAKNPASVKKPASKKKPNVDVTKDRISEGGRKVERPAEGKKKKSASSAKDKKKSSPKEKSPVGSKARQPKGKDTRNIESREKRTIAQKEKKRARERAKSVERAKQQSREGISYDEMRKKTSRTRRLRRKIIAAVTVLVSLVAVAFCVGAYVYEKGAPVAVINIEGESRYKDKKIIETADIHVGINMLSVREKTVNSAVTKALPYIRDVQIDYQFPDTLVLNVTPTEEKLLIIGETGYICLDEEGKILSLKKKKLTDGRYLVEGFKQQKVKAGEYFIPSEKNKEKYDKAKEIVAVIEKTGKFKKGTIDVSDLENISVLYDSRINIYLGNCSRLESQINFAMEIIENDEDIKNGQSGYIETRYEGQATFKPGSTKK